jgi:hypothetical protein
MHRSSSLRGVNRATKHSLTRYSFLFFFFLLQFNCFNGSAVGYAKLIELRGNVSQLILATDLANHQRELTGFRSVKQMMSGGVTSGGSGGAGGGGSGGDAVAKPSAPVVAAAGTHSSDTPTQPWSTVSSRFVFSKLLLKAADVSHSCRPLVIHQFWSESITQVGVFFVLFCFVWFVFRSVLFVFC